MEADSAQIVRDNEIVTFRQFAQENPAWTEASLRWLRFNEAQNGLASTGAFIQQASRVLIDKPKFFQWVRRGQKKSA